MKLFKKLASIATAITLALSFCAFSTACGEESADAYTFIVKNADGSAAQDVAVQLCIYAEDGVTQTACYSPVEVDASGKCVYAPDGFPGEGLYAIHVLENMSAQVEFDGPHSTTAEYGEYTLTLKD